MTPQLPDIQLVWPSNVEDNDDFRSLAWENARQVFFHHLVPCPSNAFCAFGLHFDALSEYGDPSELIKTLQELCFHNLVDGYVYPDVPDRFVTFLDWIVGEVGPLRVLPEQLSNDFISGPGPSP